MQRWQLVDSLAAQATALSSPVITVSQVPRSSRARLVATGCSGRRWRRLRGRRAGSVEGVGVVRRDRADVAEHGSGEALSLPKSL